MCINCTIIYVINLGRVNCTVCRQSITKPPSPQPAPIALLERAKYYEEIAAQYRTEANSYYAKYQHLSAQAAAALAVAKDCRDTICREQEALTRQRRIEEKNKELQSDLEECLRAREFEANDTSFRQPDEYKRGFTILQEQRELMKQASYTLKQRERNVTRDVIRANRIVIRLAEAEAQAKAYTLAVAARKKSVAAAQAERKTSVAAAQAERVRLRDEITKKIDSEIQHKVSLGELTEAKAVHIRKRLMDAALAPLS
jgi:5'-3' exonuclease